MSMMLHRRLQEINRREQSKAAPKNETPAKSTAEEVKPEHETVRRGRPPKKTEEK